MTQGTVRMLEASLLRRVHPAAQFERIRSALTPRPLRRAIRALRVDGRVHRWLRPVYPAAQFERIRCVVTVESTTRPVHPAAQFERIRWPAVTGSLRSHLQ